MAIDTNKTSSTPSASNGGMLMGGNPLGISPTIRSPSVVARSKYHDRNVPIMTNTKANGTSFSHFHFWQRYLYPYSNTIVTTAIVNAILLLCMREFSFFLCGCWGGKKESVPIGFIDRIKEVIQDDIRAVRSWWGSAKDEFQLFDKMMNPETERKLLRTGSERKFATNPARKTPNTTEAAPIRKLSSHAFCT